MADNHSQKDQRREKSPKYGILLDNRVIYGIVYAIKELNVGLISTSIVMIPVEEWHQLLSGFSLFKYRQPVIYSSCADIHRDCLEPAVMANKVSIKASITTTWKQPRSLGHIGRPTSQEYKVRWPFVTAVDPRAVTRAYGPDSRCVNS